jgi:hypothetical protein
LLHCYIVILLKDVNLYLMTSDFCLLTSDFCLLNKEIWINRKIQYVYPGRRS